MKDLTEHKHSDIVNGTGAAGSSVAAFIAFMGAAIVEYVFNADRVRWEFYLAVLVSSVFWFGIRKGRMSQSEWTLKRVIAVVGAIVAIYSSSNGYSVFLQTQRMEVVGEDNVEQASFLPDLMGAPPRLPPVNAKYHRAGYHLIEVELPREWGRGKSAYLKPTAYRRR